MNTNKRITLLIGSTLLISSASLASAPAGYTYENLTNALTGLEVNAATDGDLEYTGRYHLHWEAISGKPLKCYEGEKMSTFEEQNSGLSKNIEQRPVVTAYYKGEVFQAYENLGGMTMYNAENGTTYVLVKYDRRTKEQMNDNTTDYSNLEYCLVRTKINNVKPVFVAPRYPLTLNKPTRETSIAYKSNHLFTENRNTAVFGDVRGLCAGRKKYPYMTTVGGTDFRGELDMSSATCTDETIEATGTFYDLSYDSDQGCKGDVTLKYDRKSKKGSIKLDVKSDYSMDKICDAIDMTFTLDLQEK